MLSILPGKIRSIIALGKAAAAELVEKTKAVFPTENWTLAEAADWLLPRALVGKTTLCPCCGQNVQISRRTLHSAMARVLCLMYARYFNEPDADGWLHVDKLLRDAGLGCRDFSLLEKWGLIERYDGVRKDGSKRTGFWRITQKGVDFIEEQMLLEAAFWMYNDESYGFVNERIGIRAALRSGGFVYRDILIPLLPDWNIKDSKLDIDFIAKRKAKQAEKEAKKKAKEKPDST